MIIEEHKTIFTHIPKNAGSSIEEYFANGFEKYFLDDPHVVQKISPILYEKIESILNEQA